MVIKSKRILCKNYSLGLWWGRVFLYKTCYLCAIIISNPSWNWS